MSGRELADLTTLRLGGPCHDVVTVCDDDALIAAVSDADERGIPLLLLGGGSNVVVADEGWPGRVVLIRTTGVDPGGDDAVTVAAGESWAEFVDWALAAGRVGIEALAGIPGSVGATPVQNVGAYGAEVADTLVAVEAWDRKRGERTLVSRDKCEFGYRDSIFKRNPGRWVVLNVTYALPAGTLSAPVRYAELARRLGVGAGERATATEVAQTVVALRRAKGMVLDPSDHDTWSAGSFFTNPVLDAATASLLPRDAPQYPDGTGRVKTSAAWLIEHAGFSRGFRATADSRVALSSKHTLALTNRGAASTKDLLELARTIRAGVREKFAIDLAPEPVLVGCAL